MRSARQLDTAPPSSSRLSKSAASDSSPRSARSPGEVEQLTQQQRVISLELELAVKIAPASLASTPNADYGLTDDIPFSAAPSSPPTTPSIKPLTIAPTSALRESGSMPPSMPFPPPTTSGFHRSPSTATTEPSEPIPRRPAPLSAPPPHSTSPSGREAAPKATSSKRKQRWQRQAELADTRARSRATSATHTSISRPPPANSRSRNVTCKSLAKPRTLTRQRFDAGVTDNVSGPGGVAPPANRPDQQHLRPQPGQACPARAIASAADNLQQFLNFQQPSWIRRRPTCAALRPSPVPSRIAICNRFRTFLFGTAHSRIVATDLTRRRRRSTPLQFSSGPVKFICDKEHRQPYPPDADCSGEKGSVASAIRSSDDPLINMVAMLRFS